MVAVPGRSKGCKTCRRRKKGCDKIEPTCGQCRAAGLVCGGYGRDLIWVHASAPEPAKIEDAEAREASISPHIVPWRAHYAVSEGEGINIVLHDSLVRSARQTKYLGTFWSVYLPDGKEFSALARQRTPCGWTDTLGQLYDSEPTLQMAALAISTSVMGGESNDQQLRIKGMQTYSRALQEMSVALKDSKRWLGDGLLAAVRIMELYEVIFGADTQKYQQANRHVAGWRGHNAGQLAIILARGPESFRDGPGHKLFADARLQVLLGALTKRKQSPLSQRKWRTVPWELEKKSYSDEIIDLLLGMGGLLEQLDNIRACSFPNEVPRLREALLQDCLKAHSGLQRWRTEMGSELEVYDVDVTQGALPTPQTDMDLAQLHLTHVYWCVCIFLYSTTEFLLPAVAGSKAGSQAADDSTTGAQTPEGSDRPAAGSETATPTSGGLGAAAGSPADTAAWAAFLGYQPRTYARKVAHSVHLFWEPGIGAFGNQISLFPLGLALRYYMATADLENCSEFWLMCKLFYRPFLGSVVGRFLMDLEKDDVITDKGAQVGIMGAQTRAMEWFNGKKTQSQAAK